MAGPEISSLREEKEGDTLVCHRCRGGPNNRSESHHDNQAELHVDFLQERTTFSDHLHQLVRGSSSYLNLPETGREGEQVPDTVQLSGECHHSQN